MTRRERAVLDVADLPETVFGPRDIMWWGTVGFAVIEGFTLALAAVVFLYLRTNEIEWPPLGTPLPSLGAPTAQVLVMLASIPFMAWLSRAAHRFDLRRVRIGLLVASAFIIAMVVLRAFELRALNVRWDTNAYGSAQWLIFAAHATLLAIEMVEVMGIGALFWIGPVEEKHFSDAADVAFYWYFMVLVWMPFYVLCVLGPRWM